MFISGRIEIQGPPALENWPSFATENLRFDLTADGVAVTSTSGETDRDALTRRVKDQLSPLSYWVAFHGLVAQAYCLTSLARTTGEHVRIGAFDLNLVDPRDWRGLSRVPSLDLAEARDFWIERILGAIVSSSAQALGDDLTLLRAVEALLRAVVAPSTVLANTYPAIEHVQKRLEGRAEFSRIGLSKADVDFVMLRANALADGRSRHAHPPDEPVVVVPDWGVQECLRRARRVIEAYAISVAAQHGVAADGAAPRS